MGEFRRQGAPLLFATSLMLMVGAYIAVAKTEETPKGNPKELGRVAILPFLDISGEGQEAKDGYRETAMAEVEERFRKYEIEYVKREEMTAALTTLKLAPTDEEDRAKAKLKTLADYLKVRYVVTGVIHDANSGWRKQGLFREGKAGQAKVQFRVFDATTERYAEELELTVCSTARAKAFSSGVFSRANKLRVKAVRDATKKAMAAFIKPYPKVHNEDPAQASAD